MTPASLNEIHAVVMAIMVTTFEALFVFLLFVPGFLTQRIMEVLTPRRVRDTFERVVGGGILSLAVYALYILLVSLPFGWPRLPVEYVPDIKLWEIHYEVGGLILLISVVLGAVLGRWIDSGYLFYLLRGDYVHPPKPTDKPWCARMRKRIRRALHFTSGTGRDSVWEDALRIQRSPFVKVTLSSGRAIVGKCIFYSDDPRSRELLIIPPDVDLAGGDSPSVLVVDSATSTPRPLPGPGVLINADADIESVEFLGPKDVQW